MVGLVLALSLLPLPDAFRPLLFLREPEPLAALGAALFSRAESMAGQEQGAPAPPPEIAEAAEEVEKGEVKPVAAKKRKRWLPPPRDKYEKIRAAVGAAPEPVINPCVEGSEQRCTRRALERFFQALSEVESGAAGSVVRVVHFGDSLIASDHITDLVRLRLQERFGSGGAGFLLVDRLSRFAGRRVRTGLATEGWRLDVITQAKPVDDLFGYSGASFTSERAGAASLFEVRGSRSVEIYYLRQPEGGGLEVWADNQLLRTIDTRGAQEVSIEGLTLPVDAVKLKLVANAPLVRVFGVSMEAGVPGVVYESLGLPGATSDVWLVPREADFASQLLHRSPVLVVTMLGGNDALMLSKQRTTTDAIQKASHEFVRRLRASAPDADCLIVSPMDSARTKGKEIVSKPEVLSIIAIQKEVALEEDCAFWDMWASMGGTGALERWWKAGMINPDMIHPKGYGGDLLGEMMVSSLMDAYDRWSGGETVAAATSHVTMGQPIRIDPIVLDPIPLTAEAEGGDAGGTTSLGSEVLEPFLDRLAELERNKKGRAGIAVLGSDLVARRVFTDRFRGVLAAKLGYRGRGFSVADRGSTNLEEAAPRRSLTGAFTVHAGPEGGAHLGMGGLRTELRAGARFTFAPCPTCSPAEGLSTFDVFFLARPGAGTARVELSGLPAERVPASEEGEPRLIRRRYVTAAPGPTLAVEADSMTPVELLGVAHELDAAGVVVDAIGTPALAVDGALRWDAGLVLAMLAARSPDLLVVAYGDVEAERETLDGEAFGAAFARLLRRLRTGTDDGPCLVLAPLGELRRQPGGGWLPLPAQAMVERVEREAAQAEDCAFLSLGELIAAERDGLYEPVSKGDRRRLSDQGLERLGERFAGVLLDRYAERAGRPPVKSQDQP